MTPASTFFSSPPSTAARPDAPAPINRSKTADRESDGTATRFNEALESARRPEARASRAAEASDAQNAANAKTETADGEIDEAVDESLKNPEEADLEVSKDASADASQNVDSAERDADAANQESASKSSDDQSNRGDATGLGAIAPIDLNAAGPVVHNEAAHGFSEQLAAGQSGQHGALGMTDFVLQSEATASVASATQVGANLTLNPAIQSGLAKPGTHTNTLGTKHGPHGLIANGSQASVGAMGPVESAPAAPAGSSATAVSPHQIVETPPLATLPVGPAEFEAPLPLATADPVQATALQGRETLGGELNFTERTDTGSTTASGRGTATGPTVFSDSVDATDRLNTARLSRGLRNAVTQRGGGVTLRLTPPTLGTVRIEMNLQQSNVSAHLTAETDQAASLLQRQLGTLKTALEQQGLNVERLTVQSMANGSAATAEQDQAGERREASQQERQNGGRRSSQSDPQPNVAFDELIGDDSGTAVA